MKLAKIMAAALAAAAAAANADVAWKGLEKANHVCGPVLTPESLKGKVVLVDEWGIHCGPCLRLLPAIQKLHSTWSGKGLVVIGSHRQGGDAKAVADVAKKVGVTYSIYQHAGIEGEPSNGGGIPFLYVVSHKGEVVYSGRSEREATGAMANAISDAPSKGAAFGSGELKFYKQLARRIAYGNNLEAAAARLKIDAKADTPKGREAAAILESIERIRTDAAARIADCKTSAPAKAVAEMEMYARTFPSRRAEFAKDLSALKANREVQQMAILEKRIDAFNARWEKAKSVSQKKSLAREAENLLKQTGRFSNAKDAGVAAEAAGIESALKEKIAEAGAKPAK